MNNEEYAKVIAANLRRLLYENDITPAQMSRDLRISKSTISTWTNGTRIPRMSKIDLLCDYLHCDRSTLMERPVDRLQQNPTMRIPVFTSVSAGSGAFADGNIEGFTDIPSSMALAGDYFGLRVKGDSMEPTIMDGDLLVVRKDPAPRTGQIVIAIVNGDEGFVKKFVQYPAAIGLISENPAYLPLLFSDKDVESLPVQILGIVERIVRDLR